MFCDKCQSENKHNSSIRNVHDFHWDLCQTVALQNAVQKPRCTSPVGKCLVLVAALNPLQSFSSKMFECLETKAMQHHFSLGASGKYCQWEPWMSTRKELLQRLGNWNNVF